ncbi:DUF7002 family protein [Paenibacillus spongiae]|uniref:DUF4433 domain-containing protein n=1 Tax=Paenibacillus spongiae TaxID=2909671 RepID=A0ABY5S4T3_9BACL|nr:hypothetical protein [Paenibacillus spongiae]UVI27753.1 hypothetical protein L1F29_20055 [Paenibacillus spongiae]
MRDAVIAAITKASSRKSLYHFTRARNLPTIAYFDALMSSSKINPHAAGERRQEVHEVIYSGCAITINAHLRIPDQMMDASCTQEQFRTHLDRHVFFWPTWRDCQTMMESYARREPDERFAVLKFDAYPLLAACYSAVKLSKYDSGSSPRYPKHCNYKKSPRMFLPINIFNSQSKSNSPVPTKPSEIREILIEDQVMNVSRYLQAIYVEHDDDVPVRWRELAKHQADLRAEAIKQ